MEIATMNELRSRRDEYCVRVKEEYILEAPRDTSVNENETDEKNGQNKRPNVCFSKKRPRDDKVANKDKLCYAYTKGKCKFDGDKCKFSHDLLGHLKARPKDIEVDDGAGSGGTIPRACPNFERLDGYCPYGISCRFGSVHLNLETGENMGNPPKNGDRNDIMNLLKKDVQIQLRKRTYPFVCKRRCDETSKQQKNVLRKDTCKKTDTSKDLNRHTAENNSPATSVTKNFDLSPLPVKRKIIDFSNKVYIAPLTTVGNLPFRRVMKKFQADITCGEMALCENILQGQPSEWALLKRHTCEDVYGVQIASGYADQFTRTAELLAAEVDCDFVDMNLGCPIDLVCRKGAGASLMLRQERLHDCLKGVTSALSCPVTVKMRTGWDGEKPIAHKLVPAIQSWKLNVGAIMVHGRSRLQRYSRLANWDYIGDVSKCQSDEFPKISVIGNGDIYTYRDYEKKVAIDGLSATAMLARGALIKPWLPTEIKERRDWDISASERLDILKDFVNFGLEHWGSDQQGVNHTRRFLLEWLSFLYRYIPIGMLETLETLPQMNQRPPLHMCGRNDLETLMLSKNCSDWIRISELLLGKVPDGFKFAPKHKANAY